ncbi:MAG: RodZ domain-containing protein [Tahibacter sp.]
MTEVAAVDAAMPTTSSDGGRELFSMPGDVERTTTEHMGSRLSAARDARGWSVDEVATRLRLPQRVVRSLESGEFAQFEHDVYLRGYLTSYTRLLGISAPNVTAELEQRTAQEMPTLVATGRISHSRYLFERYSVPAVYVVLTALIVAPAVWLAGHGGLEQNLARLTPLDAAPASELTARSAPDNAPANESLPTALTDTANTQSAMSGQISTPGGSPDAPLMASLAAFPTLPSGSAAPDAGSVFALGESRLHLSLREASWVEIIGADGHRYEFGLLPAGAQRDYNATQPVTVRLGNAVGAELSLNGKSLDIIAYRRSNVAHFRVQDGNVGAITSDN